MLHLITNKSRQYKAQAEEAQRLREELRSTREELESTRAAHDRAKNDNARLLQGAATRGLEDGKLIRGLRRDLERLETAIAALTDGDFHEAEPQENTDRVLRRLIDRAPQLGLDGAWLQRMTGLPTPLPARVTLLLCYGNVFAAYRSWDGARAAAERKGADPHSFGVPASRPSHTVQQLDTRLPWLPVEVPVFGSVKNEFVWPAHLTVLTSRGEVPEAYATVNAAEEDLLGRDPSWQLQYTPVPEVLCGDRHGTYAPQPATAGSQNADHVPF